MLRVCDLSLRYPGGKLALTDFSLEVQPGELVVVLGGNGSGKSTLLRCITRTLKPSAGEVWLDGINLCALEGEKLRQARLGLAMVWQQVSLVRRTSVLANVASGALGRYSTLRTVFAGLPADELEAARDHLADVGLHSRRSAPVRCRAARPSVWRSHALWHSGLACCWPMNRSQASIRKRPKKSCGSCKNLRTPSNSACCVCCTRSSSLTPTRIV